MKEAGNVRIWTSILRRQNTVAQFIVTRPILGLCEVALRRPGGMGLKEMVGENGDRLEGGQGKGGRKDEVA